MEKVIAFVITMEKDQVLQAIQDATSRIIMLGLFGAKARRRVANHLGISLQDDWRITDEYLRKKTIKEILALGEDLQVFSDHKAQSFLHEQLGKKFSKFNMCKKQELIRVFMESGVDLAGKVPKEILDD